MRWTWVNPFSSSFCRCEPSYQGVFYELLYGLSNLYADSSALLLFLLEGFKFFEYGGFSAYFLLDRDGFESRVVVVWHERVVFKRFEDVVRYLLNLRIVGATIAIQVSVDGLFTHVY